MPPRENLERRIITSERLTRVETVQAGMAADVTEIKDAVLGMGKALSTHMEKEEIQMESLRDDLLEIKTDIKLINARHRNLKKKVALLGAIVGAVITGAIHKAADWWALLFPHGGAK